ncbi:ATP cone domain-containing protein [Haloimpatiens sp. FM7330]|uniref:ATP cone domain-containing protein n=1 Tax=Haloimpatiens sp. FM7330 TaxID=3298610 RepID=UPI00363B84D4
MKVVKKDGRIENFDISKVMTTIARASDDANTPLTSSDVENLSEDVRDNIVTNYKDPVHVIQIRDAVIRELQKLGFRSIASVYDTGKVERR